MKKKISTLSRPWVLYRVVFFNIFHMFHYSSHQLSQSVPRFLPSVWLGFITKESVNPVSVLRFLLRASFIFLHTKQVIWASSANSLHRIPRICLCVPSVFPHSVNKPLARPWAETLLCAEIYRRADLRIVCDRAEYSRSLGLQSLPGGNLLLTASVPMRKILPRKLGIKGHG